MRTLGLHTRVASFVGAVALLIQISPAMAIADDHNRPVDITFTKWGVTAPPLPAPQPPFGLFEGFFNDGLPGSFVAEVLWRQLSLNGHVNGLEALYEVVDGDRSFSATTSYSASSPRTCPLKLVCPQRTSPTKVPTMSPPVTPASSANGG